MSAVCGFVCDHAIGKGTCTTVPRNDQSVADDEHPELLGRVNTATRQLRSLMPCAACWPRVRGDGRFANNTAHVFAHTVPLI